MIKDLQKQWIQNIVNNNIEKLSVIDISMIKHYYGIFNELESDLTDLFIARVDEILKEKNILEVVER
tara:strand:+ start:49 stop:249 length:201 start_codon:yes stop_codon:yes gene_type:complete